MSTEEIIYLDHAAATPLDHRVLEAMQPYFSDKFYNPSSSYAPAVALRREYEDAKHRIAMAIGAKKDEIIITAGATESINMAISSQEGHIVTSSTEHPAVLESVRGRDTGIVVVDNRSCVDPQSVAKLLRPNTQLVSIHLANNETGTVQPIRDIAQVVEKERKRRREAGETKPIYLHTDASQGAGQIDINVARLGVDMLTLNAGKMYGPKQVGLLWVKTGVQVSPMIYGGGQERGLRSGTENVAGVMGFAKALEIVQAHCKGEAKRLAHLRDELQRQLQDKLPEMKVIGSQKRRLAGHLLISLPGIDAERVLFMCDMNGVLVATGSACAANKGTRSHVLVAMGLDDKTVDGSLRITLGRLSNQENIKRAGDILINCIQQEQKRMAQ